MDSEETNPQESQGEKITQQDVEAMKRKAERVVGKLKLREELQNPRTVESLYLQVSEKLNSQAVELNRQLAEAQNLQFKRLEEALRRQAAELSKEFIRRTEESMSRQAIALQAELNNREAALIRRTKELNDREIAFQKAHALEDSIAKNIVDAGAGDFQRIAASQMELGDRYYKKVLQQANVSFWWALIAAVVGLFFFLVASGLILRQLETISNVSLISGVVVEVISGIGFTLFAHASRQLESFHVRLDRTLLFLFANSVCEHLKTELKETTRAELVLSMANSSQPAGNKGRFNQTNSLQK
jgi:hypothetical protein